jgi:hypothetical protein
MNRYAIAVGWVVAALLLFSVSCATGKPTTEFRHPALAQRAVATAAAASVARPAFDGNPRSRAEDARSIELRLAVARAARGYVGKRALVAANKKLPFDCSGLARASYLQLGIDLTNVEPIPDENAVTTLYRYVKRNGILYRNAAPAVGDLAFFNDTFDRNSNGKRDDPLTHVAVVESIDADGTIVIVHRVTNGILRYRMNLRHPELIRDPGSKKRINHFLRKSGSGIPSLTTAQLFAGFGTVIRNADVVPADSRVAAR